MSLDQSIQLLRHFKWNNDKIMNEWLDERKQGQVRIEMGLSLDPNLLHKFPFLNQSCAKQNGGHCIICYSPMTSTVPRQAIALDCGHQFCKQCWIDYLTQRVRDGAHAIFTRCP